MKWVGIIYLADMKFLKSFPLSWHTDQ